MALEVRCTNSCTGGIPRPALMGANRAGPAGGGVGGLQAVGQLARPRSIEVGVANQGPRGVVGRRSARHSDQSCGSLGFYIYRY